ncbi:unnamed protein product [Ixodes persulcatus]
MQKLIRSRSSNAKDTTKDVHKLAKHAKDSLSPSPINKPQEPQHLLDIGTIQEMYDDFVDLHQISALIYSTKFRTMRNKWFWESACNKGYFIHRKRARETILRPVLRLYYSVTDVTSDAVSSRYDLQQPFLSVRSRRTTEPYCKLARQLWLQYKMPKRPPGCFRLLGLSGVSFPPPTVRSYQVDGLLAHALSTFQDPHDLVMFPVLSNLKTYFQDATDFLSKMTALRDKSRSPDERPDLARVRSRSTDSKQELAVKAMDLTIVDWPWRTPRLPGPMPQPYQAAGNHDSGNVYTRVLAPERQELHASRNIAVCLLYRMSLVTRSILQYLVFINVEGQAAQDLADEVLVATVRQQMTESVQEMYLDPSTRLVDALFNAVMTRTATLVHQSGSSKHLRVRTLQQCRLGSAVATWQLVTLLLSGVGEAFSEAVVGELGREDKRRRYCVDFLALVPRLKDDCLYRLFNTLQLWHRKLSLLQAQHTDSLDPVADKAVALLAKTAVTCTLHLFRTQRVQLRHVYLRRRELQEDFGHFLACLNGTFSVMAPQPAVTVDAIAGGRLRLFMVDMLVHYYTEVVESSGDSQQTVLE